MPMFSVAEKLDHLFSVESPLSPEEVTARTGATQADWRALLRGEQIDPQKVARIHEIFAAWCRRQLTPSPARHALLRQRAGALRALAIQH